MKTNSVVFLSLFALTALTVGCKSDVTGEYVQNGNSSLRLFEESTGSLLDLKNGRISVEVETSSLNPLIEYLVLRMKSDSRSYLIHVQKNKISADGSFELNETEMEQPIRLKGKLVTGLAECSFANLLTAEKIGVEITVFKGFSAIETPIGFFKTELKFEAGQKQAKL